MRNENGCYSYILVNVHNCKNHEVWTHKAQSCIKGVGWQFFTATVKNGNGKNKIINLKYKILLCFQEWPLTNDMQNTRKGFEGFLFFSKTT